MGGDEERNQERRARVNKRGDRGKAGEGNKRREEKEQRTKVSAGFVTFSFETRLWFYSVYYVY